jgi:hypothetical protein
MGEPYRLSKTVFPCTNVHYSDYVSKVFNTTARLFAPPCETACVRYRKKRIMISIPRTCFQSEDLAHIRAVYVFLTVHIRAGPGEIPGDILFRLLERFGIPCRANCDFAPLPSPHCDQDRDASPHLREPVSITQKKKSKIQKRKVFAL